MKYTKLSGMDKSISNIIFGCCNPIMVRDEKDAEKLPEAAFAEGINTFDAAKVYGKSEEVLGRWIKDSGLREKVVIITKGCHPDTASRMNVGALKEDVESSLERLQTDYIDIYMLHRDDPDSDMRAMLTELNEYKKKGIIRKIGVSNWSCDRIDAVNTMASEMGLDGFSVSSPQMSLARQIRDPWGGGCVSISWDEKAGGWYSRHPEIPVFAYSCLGHGFFSGKIRSARFLSGWKKLDHAARNGYWCKENLKRLRVAEKMAKEKNCSVSQIALAWCMSQSYQVFPIATASSVQRIKENAAALDIRLTDEEIERLRKSGS